MAEIQTARGAISPDELGTVMLSERLLFGVHGWQEAPEVNFDHVTAFEKICGSLTAFKALGGKTIVDTSGITMGRDIKFFASLSKETGINIIAATGFENEPFLLPFLRPQE